MCWLTGWLTAQPTIKRGKNNQLAMGACDEEGEGDKAMAMGIRVVGDKEGEDDEAGDGVGVEGEVRRRERCFGGKSDGNEGGRRLMVTSRVMAMVTAMTWVMALVTRLARDEEGKGEGGKGDGAGDEGGGRQRGNSDGSVSVLVLVALALALASVSAAVAGAGAGAMSTVTATGASSFAEASEAARRGERGCR